MKSNPMLSTNKRESDIKQKGNLSLHKHSTILGYAFICCLCNASQAAEVAPFKVTGFGGLFSITSQSDKQKSVSSDGTSRTSDGQFWQEKVSLDVSSYAYHPNFLKMDFGAGLLFNQKTRDSSDQENSRVANLSAKFNFLHKKPTPVTVYYNQTNTYTPTGLTDSYLLEQIEYGANIGLLHPLSPVNTQLSASRVTNYGKNNIQVTDEVNERVKLDMRYSYGASLAYINLSHQINDRTSKSGNLALPITARETSSSTTGLKTRNGFGSENQLRLNTNTEYRKQDDFPGRESWFFRPKLDWEHNKRFSSYYTYSINHTDEQGIETENNKATARLRYSGDNMLSGNVGLSHGTNESTNIKSESTGANLGISKKIPVSYGQYSLAYNANINIQDQTSTSNFAPVDNEPHTLTGTTSVTLNQDYIDTNSITVTDSTGPGPITTYTEGTDYIVTIVGDQILIERTLIGSTILDPQNVFITYSYQTGGTYKKQQLSQNFNFGLDIGKYYDIYIRLYKTDDKLKEGVPTIGLNSSDGVRLQLRADRPLKKGLTVGGDIEAQQHNEDKNPYNRQSISAFINTPLYAKARLRLSAGLIKRDNENSEEDVNTKTLGVRIGVKPWTRVSMLFESNYSQNTGGSIEHTTLYNNLDFYWKYRKLNYKATVKYQLEEQGLYERDNLSIFMRLTRPF